MSSTNNPDTTKNLFFISEISSNHNKSLERSLKLIEASAESGCSAVKFQLFKIDKLFSVEVLSQSEKHRKRKEWELPVEFIPELSKKCKELGLKFSCTPFYIEAVSQLEPYVDFYKIASYELLWDDLLIEVAKTRKEIILSTGMASLSEIKHAVDVLRANDCSKLTLLHCISAYPTPYQQANLSAIKTIRDHTSCDVGWSDHTADPIVIHRAISKWNAKTIEFHIDLDGKGGEAGIGHCWLPHQIKKVIFDANRSLLADGDGIKAPVKAEFNDRLWRADPTDGLRPMKEIRDKWQTF